MRPYNPSWGHKFSLRRYPDRKKTDYAPTADERQAGERRRAIERLREERELRETCDDPLDAAEAREEG